MNKKITLFSNLSLLLLVIMSGVVAACLHRLPSHSNSPIIPPVVNNGIQASETIDNKHDSTHTKDSKTVTLREMAGNDGYKDSPASPVANDVASSVTFSDTDIHRLQTPAHPFANEARKILAGGLQAEDSASRRKILNYCEHFRTAYTSKDIDFIRQVLSDKALIIVGHTVRTDRNANSFGGSQSVMYSVRSKQQYLRNLTAVFAANKKIDVTFSDFRILRHPTMEGIYGVTLRQKYASDLYSDDGYLFLLWDFREPSMPRIHVRTWQPAEAISDEDDVIGFADFNLE